MLPIDCLGAGPEDPLRRIWRASPGGIDFETIFSRAAAIVFRQLAESRGPGLSWLGLPGAPATHPDLYNGWAGIAIFAAALGTTAGRKDGIQLAREIAQELGTCAPRTPGALGAGQGAGGAAYTLLTVGELLGDDSLVDRAFGLARFAPADIAGDRAFDVVGGCAGWLLVLEKLLARGTDRGPAEVRPLLSRLREAAAHLIAHSQVDDRGRSWRCGGREAGSGFAHGASGIAVALARSRRFLTAEGAGRAAAAIGEALRFEASLYSPQAGNWLPSHEERERNPCAWCRGAPGIALARIELLASRAAPPEELLPELEQALRITLCRPPLPLDHVCCGTLSRAETLLCAFERFGAAEDLEAARWIGLWVLRAAKTRGSFSLGTEDARDPSFFQGLSGIGYTFLRLALPGRLPSVLSFG